MMRRASLLLFTTLALPAQAQQAIPDTVVTAARVPTAAERVPVATNTITRADIEERGYVTLADALAQVPGFAIVGQGGPGTLASGFVRGLNSNHVQVLLDGVPANDVTTPGNQFNFGSLLLAGVERIEVLRGPASALYGSNALGGVVNIVSRRAPTDRPLEVFGGAAGGTQRTLRLDGGVAGTVGNFDYLFAVDSLSTGGFNIIPPRLATNRGEADNFRGAATLARLGWTPLPGLRIEGTLRWQEMNFAIDRFANDDPNFRAIERRWMGQVRAETELLGGAWVTGLRLGVTDDRRQYTNLPDALSGTRANDLFTGTRTTLDWGNRVRLPEAGAARDGTLAFGVTWLRESSRSASGNAPFRTVVDAQQDTTAGHLAVQYRLWDRLDLSAGLRFDGVEGFGTATTYRLGAVYNLPEANLRLRGAFGTAFAAPTLFQRFGVSGFFTGNPSLRPERSASWEIGIEHDVDALGRPRLATLSATYFQSWARDLIASNPSFTSLINVQRAHIEGVEVGAVLRISPWLETRAAWTFTRAFNPDTNQRLLRRPENIVALSARIAPLPGVVIVPEVLVTGATQDFAVANSGASGFTPTRKVGGTTGNLTVSYQLTPAVNLYIQARNLGFSRFEPTSGFVIPGRSVLFGTRFTL